MTNNYFYSCVSIAALACTLSYANDQELQYTWLKEKLLKEPEARKCFEQLYPECSEKAIESLAERVKLENYTKVSARLPSWVKVTLNGEAMMLTGTIGSGFLKAWRGKLKDSDTLGRPYCIGIDGSKWY